MTRDLKAEASMLIRRPVVELFEAFTNPEITTRFWFTKSRGRLEVGKTVTWEWKCTVSPRVSRSMKSRRTGES
jgi:uncharacterized protein YndB with AHSA1/START domain